MGKHFTDRDSGEVQTCIHEAAHAVAFRTGGIKVSGLKLSRGIFGGLHGGVTQPSREVSTDKEMRALLVGAVAGWRAQALCVHRYYDCPRGKALRITRDGATHDLELFHENVAEVGWSESKACDKADSLVKSKWKEIERIADKLARHGSLGSLWHW